MRVVIAIQAGTQGSGDVTWAPSHAAQAVLANMDPSKRRDLPYGRILEMVVQLMVSDLTPGDQPPANLDELEDFLQTMIQRPLASS